MRDIHQGETGKAYRKLAPDPCMHTGVAHQLLFMSNVEKCAMGDPRLLGDSAWIAGPSVEVSVEVNDGHGPVYFVE